METIINRKVAAGICVNGCEVSGIAKNGVVFFEKELTPSVLRNIQIGDDLSGKTIYCSFPDNFYEEEILGTEFENILDYSFIKCANLNSIKQFINDDNEFYIACEYENSYSEYVFLLWYGELIVSNNEIILPNDYGLVLEIYNNHPAYKYLKIKE